MPVPPGDRSAVASFVRAGGSAVVATTDAAGRPEAALVGIAALDEGTLIIDSAVDARKVVNIERTPSVAVVVGLTGGISLQLEGTASVTAGADRAAYAHEYAAQHPGSRAFDERFAVIAIDVTWVRVYDTTTDPPTVAEAVWSD